MKVQTTAFAAVYVAAVVLTATAVVLAEYGVVDVITVLLLLALTVIFVRAVAHLGELWK